MRQNAKDCSSARMGDGSLLPPSFASDSWTSSRSIARSRPRTGRGIERGWSGNTRLVGLHHACVFYKEADGHLTGTLVKPDATPEEIRTAIDNDQAGGGQVFANAVSHPVLPRVGHL